MVIEEYKNALFGRIQWRERKQANPVIEWILGCDLFYFSSEWTHYINSNIPARSMHTYI